MKRPTRVYIAGPITLGDQFQNVMKAIELGDRLLREGYVPFIPHLTCYWHAHRPHEPKTWYEYDYHWLDLCDCLISLPGKSLGTEAEIMRMRELGRPVFKEITTFCRDMPKTVDDSLGRWVYQERKHD